MEGERKLSKGSFFNFFDWNGKSRKKVFAKDPELPVGTEQGKENNVEPVAKLESRVRELDNNPANSSVKRSGGFSCSSSVTSDDGFGTRAPGVVARLMGLNSLPTSNVAEPSSTPFFDSFSHRETQHEYNPMEYIGISRNPEGAHQDSLGSRSTKVQNRPIERFQTETLPRKLSKSVSVQDLKQKTETARIATSPQRSNEMVASKNRKGQLSDRWQSGSQGRSSSKASILTEKGTSACLKNKGQVKSNAQIKDGAKPRNVNTRPNQTGTQKTKRASESRTNNVFRQNNLKQNHQKESSTSKSSVPTQQGRKAQSIRTVHKVASKPDTMSKKDKSKGTNLKKPPVKGGMDVVSFTFTSPVNKATAHPEPAPFQGVNIKKADALGALLEEKLRFLANKVESSKCNTIRDVNHLDSFDCLSTEGSRLTDNHNWQVSADVEECSTSSNFSQAEKDQYRHPSPTSILEPSFESQSFSNTHVDEVRSGFEYLEAEIEAELSDSATSICTFNTKRKHLESKDSANWELDYVRVILENAETMLTDFRLGKTSKALAPQLFHELENQHNVIKQYEEDCSIHERKVLFDCVSEWLDSISRRNFGLERKDLLARELCKEILSRKNMGDSMVDELVDKDMSSRYGKWVDFDVEMFEVGVDIEDEIVTCLVDGLIFDIL